MRLSGEERHRGPGNPGFVQHPLPKLAAQHVGMVAAHVGQYGRHHIQRTGLVIAPAHAGFHRGPLDAMQLIERQRNQDGHFVETVDMGGVMERQPHTVRPDAPLPHVGDVGLIHKLPVDAKALAIVEQMGTHKGPGLAHAAKAHLEKATGRAFAARPRDVDQLGRVSMRPERADRLTQQLQPGQLGDRPFGVINLVNRIVIWVVRRFLHGGLATLRCYIAVSCCGAGRDIPQQPYTVEDGGI